MTFDNINTISYFIKYKTINIYIIIYGFYKFINHNFVKIVFYLLAPKNASELKFQWQQTILIIY